MADGDKILIEQTPPSERDGGGALGRLLWHDPRNREWPVRPLLSPQPPRTYTWYRRGAFDQGNEGSCTAQAAAGALISSPFRMKLNRANLTAYDSYDERSDLYREAQRNDPWPGESYEGSSTDAPFKVLRARGQISEWRWCFGLDDTVRTLSNFGPVAIGVNWYESMDRPHPETGMVTAEGRVLGGHAFELVGVNVSLRTVTAMNSWSVNWGVNGRFRMSWETLDRLLNEQGEACTIIL